MKSEKVCVAKNSNPRSFPGSTIISPLIKEKLPEPASCHWTKLPDVPLKTLWNPRLCRWHQPARDQAVHQPSRESHSSEHGVRRAQRREQCWTSDVGISYL